MSWPVHIVTEEEEKRAAEYRNKAFKVGGYIFLGMFIVFLIALVLIGLHIV